MPDPSITLLRPLVAAAIKAHTDVRNCHPHPQTTVQGTTALLIPVPVDDDAMGADLGYNLDVVLLVPQTNTSWGEKLDAFVWGDRSLSAAIKADRDEFRSVGIAIEVASWENYGPVEWGDTTYWSVSQRLAVLD